jgi:NAD-dependent deacetylase
MKIVILTGAGISAESGLSTFRDNNGLWENHKVEDVATPQAFERNPDLVHNFYNLRRANLKTVSPNAAHRALAKVEQNFSEFLLVTQNVDDLHERAGSKNLIHMHGELLKKSCTFCKVISSISTDMHKDSMCEACGKTGGLRPDIVWFGEVPYEMDTIFQALMECDLFVSIGTSGNVYPAASFVEIANQSGARTVELNLEPGDQNNQFQQAHYGTATKIVPEFFNSLYLN